MSTVDTLCNENASLYKGGLDPDHVSPVDYRTELREAKARVDLPAHRAILDEFGYSLDLLLHALESHLKETGERTIGHDPRSPNLIFSYDHIIFKSA